MKEARPSAAFATVVPAEEFYAHPELLDRPRVESLTFRPPEAAKPHLRSVVGGDHMPLAALIQPAGKRHPVVRTWELPGASLQQHLNDLRKPLIEFGGPTYDDYWVIEGLYFPRKVLVSNIEPGLPIWAQGRKHLVGRVDFVADVTQMPFAAGALSAVFVSALPLVPTAVAEAWRVLEKGGLLFASASSLAALPSFTTPGFELIRAVFESHPASVATKDTNPRTGRSITLAGSISFVFAKPLY